MGEHPSFMNSYQYIPSFYKDTLSAKFFMLSTANIDHVSEYLSISTSFAFRSQYLAGQDQVIVALAFNDNHIMYIIVNKYSVSILLQYI